MKKHHSFLQKWLKLDYLEGKTSELAHACQWLSKGMLIFSNIALSVPFLDVNFMWSEEILGYILMLLVVLFGWLVYCKLLNVSFLDLIRETTRGWIINADRYPLELMCCIFKAFVLGEDEEESASGMSLSLRGCIDSAIG